MNSNGTHLTIEHDKIKYIFTGISNYCQLCPPTENVDYMVTIGTNKNYQNWQNYCYNHLDATACKKQLCNYCNRKSVIRICPKICKDCLIMILENNQNMAARCKYPNLTRSECACQFCLPMI